MFEIGIVGPLTPVSENSEVPDSPSSHFSTTTSGRSNIEEDNNIEEDEPTSPSAVPFLALFNCAEGFDWILMVAGSLGAVVHGASLAVYLHLFGKIIHLFSFNSNADQVFDLFSQAWLFLLQGGLRFGVGFLRLKDKRL
ncbi:hypothetical protein SSX86_026482 [Deinandra increscens subsp. villosa]|uniref:Uncharacterized protein n=1 Tax=Deinandra increscens subsp. villosa TaxID=3103831 RepID=A0AAP0CEM6_9ASTR